jgi:hypothetical protein
MNKHGARSLLGLLCVALLVGVAVAGSSANYAIDWDVVGGGGSEMASAHYAIKGTLSQTAIGPSSSTSYQLGSGYWYGVEVSYAIYLPLVLKNF